MRSILESKFDLVDDGIGLAHQVFKTGRFTNDSLTDQEREDAERRLRNFSIAAGTGIGAYGLYKYATRKKKKEAQK